MWTINLSILCLLFCLNPICLENLIKDAKIKVARNQKVLLFFFFCNEVRHQIFKSRKTTFMSSHNLLTPLAKESTEHVCHYTYQTEQIYTIFWDAKQNVSEHSGSIFVEVLKYKSKINTHQCMLLLMTVKPHIKHLQFTNM